jgi:hypothetical protein
MDAPIIVHHSGARTRGPGLVALSPCKYAESGNFPAPLPLLSASIQVQG